MWTLIGAWITRHGLVTLFTLSGFMTFVLENTLADEGFHYISSAPAWFAANCSTGI
jgi:hypothetical protein